MRATHFELLVEEPSMEAFLRALLPRLLPQGRTFEVHAFQGKGDLMGSRNRSESFCRFRDALAEAVG